MPILRVLVIIFLIVNLVLLSLGLGYLGRGGGGEGDRLARQVAADKIRVVSDQPPAAAHVTAPIPAPAPAPAPVAAPADVATVTAAAETAARAASEKPAPAPAVKAPLTAAAPASPPVPASVSPPPVAKATRPQSCKLVPTMPLPLAEKAAAIVKALGAVKMEAMEIPAARASFWLHIPPQKNRQAADARVEDLKAKGVQDFFIVQEEGPNHYAVSLGLYRSETMANEYMARLKKMGVTQAIITARGGEAKRDLILRGPADAVDGAIAKLSADLGELRTANCPAP